MELGTLPQCESLCLAIARNVAYLRSLNRPKGQRLRYSAVIGTVLNAEPE